MVQICGVESDTIFYHTVEIYSDSPILDVREGQSVAHAVTLHPDSYSMGRLKNLKKNYIGEPILLYTKRDRINLDNFVDFEYIEHPQWTRLARLHRMTSSR